MPTATKNRTYQFQTKLAGGGFRKFMTEGGRNINTQPQTKSMSRRPSTVRQ